MHAMERIATSLNKLSELAQIRDDKRVADATDARECGNCQHWMKSRVCPRERNVNGMTRGPSSGDPACKDFALTPRVAKLKADRIAAVEARMAKFEQS
jgi:hypothetical protein